MPHPPFADERPEWRRRLRTIGRAKQFRYMAVGGFNTLFGYATFFVLERALRAVIHYLFILLLAHVISVLVAFIGYRILVFKVRGQLWIDLARFWLVYALILAANVAVLPLMVEVAGVPVVIAQGAFTIVTAVSSYIAHGRFSFSRSVDKAAN